MNANSRGIAEVLVAACDFSSFDCGVGGGEGRLLAGILAAHPNMRGIMFDKPQVVASAPPLLASAGVDDRCDPVGGNFFDAVPAGGDAYLLKAILHDWDEAASIAILQACRRVIEPNGTLFVTERVVGQPNQGLETKISDLNMLVSPGGQERTQGKFVALFVQAGFRLESIEPAGPSLCVIDCIPI